MECIECEKLIPVYLHNELSEKDIERFIDHMNECKSCKEELTIQFLIFEGIHRLEAGDTMNVEGELTEKLNFSMKKLERRRRMRDIITIGFILSIFAFIFALLYFVI